jgi:predicted RNA-binding Zn ribbon-like protein
VTDAFVGGALCLDFANTVEWHARAVPTDRLRDYADLAEWAAAAGIIGRATARRLIRESRTCPNDAVRAFREAVEFRESVYRIMAGLAHGRRPTAADLAVVDRFVGEALGRLKLIRGSEGFRLDWQDLGADLESLLWPIARSAADLLTSTRLSRVRQCADDRGCGWLFVDRSRNRSRRWCSMDDCGNRAKAGRHFRRRKEGRGS